MNMKINYLMEATQARRQCLEEQDPPPREGKRGEMKTGKLEKIVFLSRLQLGSSFDEERKASLALLVVQDQIYACAMRITITAPHKLCKS